MGAGAGVADVVIRAAKMSEAIMHYIYSVADVLVALPERPTGNLPPAFERQRIQRTRPLAKHHWVVTMRFETRPAQVVAFRRGIR